MSDPKAVVVSAVDPAERVDREPDPVEIGQWYWVKTKDDKQPWLGCVSHVGTNYAELDGVQGDSARVHLDHFDAICAREEQPERIIEQNIATHRGHVRELMDEIQRVTAKLGIAPRSALADGSNAPSQALAVAHGTADIKAHKQALVKAHEETLPELFKKVEREHKAMATWMKAQLKPMKAQLGEMQIVAGTLEHRIFVVELYAGLTEEVVQIADGEAARPDAKVSLFQRRHYMDEECLANYEAGGMDYQDIKDFDRWLAKKRNRDRILPLPRCIVAFRVRRHDKERNAVNLADYIRIMYEELYDKQTFLYIRNGDRLFRLSTEIDFGEKLFPDRDRSAIFSNETLWIEQRFGGGVESVLSQREYEAILAEDAERKREYRRELAAWREKNPGKKPDIFAPQWYPRREKHERCTPESLYYDDAMKIVAKTAMEHNRVAVVLQGLLDRSPALHPHPPWQLWTSKGFAAGIELIYDDDRAITSGDPPDFEAYRARLNASLKAGCHTIGQEDAWLRAEAAKENARRGRSWRFRSESCHLETYQPYGNEGPGAIAPVVRVRTNGHCTFEWERQRVGMKWVVNPDKPGWMKRDNTPIKTRFSCPSSILLNVSAYTRGDFKQFFADPRTRAQYLQWAPMLLAAEDFVAGRTERKKRSRR